MDPMRIHAYKVQAVKKHKRQQLLNDVILYSLTALVCTSFCSSPLWYPPFCAAFNVFFFLSLPKISSFFFTSKVLFIVGNLIVIFLLGESKFFASKSKAHSDVCHDKYECKHSDQLQVISPPKEQKGKGISQSTSKQEIKAKICELRTCEQYDEEEFFESHSDEETCESDIVEKNTESSSHEEEELGCSKREVRVVDEKKHEALEGDRESSLPADELNKLVDAFIARIIRQRRFEAEFCRG